jgi:prevent-host-death family protein
MSTEQARSRITCGVREAKTRLSQLLEEVSRGAEVLITDRGRPVGKLVGLGPADLTLEDRLARLTLAHCLEPARDPSLLPEPLVIGANAQEYLQADRDG